MINIPTGYKSAKIGRMSIEQILSIYDSQKKDIEEKVILIRISKAFRYSLTSEELYEYTRGRWKLNPDRAKKAKYVFSVFEGIVQEIYKIETWLPAGSTYSFWLEEDKEDIKNPDFLDGRDEFIGKITEKNAKKSINLNQ